MNNQQTFEMLSMPSISEIWTTSVLRTSLSLSLSLSLLFPLFPPSLHPSLSLSLSSLETSWKAGWNERFIGMSDDAIRGMMGVLTGMLSPW